MVWFFSDQYMLFYSLIEEKGHNVATGGVLEGSGVCHIYYEGRKERAWVDCAR
jgi:hypothetical protein